MGKKAEGKMKNEKRKKGPSLEVSLKEAKNTKQEIDSEQSPLPAFPRCYESLQTGIWKSVCRMLQIRLINPD
jgi:hypothetical protein